MVTGAGTTEADGALAKDFDGDRLGMTLASIGGKLLGEGKCGVTRPVEAGTDPTGG
jgi:hypothetical protein